jgi:hypothetical protein
MNIGAEILEERNCFPSFLKVDACRTENSLAKLEIPKSSMKPKRDRDDIKSKISGNKKLSFFSGDYRNRDMVSKGGHPKASVNKDKRV